MAGSKYLRQQAATLMSLSQNCMDLSVARQLRMMAAEFKERANRAEETMPAFMVKPNGRDSGDIDPQN